MNGFAAVLKPPGVGSQRYLAELRRRLGRPHLGHLGTLDPLAAGVLVVADGFARRLADLADFDKRYVAEVLLGITTATDDLEGALRERRSAAHLGEGEVRRALAAFEGEILQVPPAFSAVQQAGVRSYRRARRDENVALPARRVRVHAAQLVQFTPGPLARALLHLHVSRGTYVRAIARDLGERLGVGGVLAALVRTDVGPFPIEEAAAPGERPLFRDAAHVLGLPALALDEERWRRLAAGQRLPARLTGLYLGQRDGETVALLEARDGLLHPRRTKARDDA